MSKHLVTFSGKFGDILWSLPTARWISEQTGEKVDFATMPQYRSMMELIQAQPYVDSAFVVEDWHLVHSNHGDQPWYPPKTVETGYTKCWHLGYRGHPGLSGQPNMSLIDFIPWQQGIRLVERQLPFLTTYRSMKPVPRDAVLNVREDVPVGAEKNFVTFAFNEMYGDVKTRFRNRLLEECPGVAFVDVTKMCWMEAATAIKSSLAFVGCRSSNWVLAAGVDAKIICFEPHPSRNQSGHLGIVFGCPYADIFNLPLNLSAEECAGAAAARIRQIREENRNEVHTAVSR